MNSSLKTIAILAICIITALAFLKGRPRAFVVSKSPNPHWQFVDHREYLTPLKPSEPIRSRVKIVKTPVIPVRARDPLVNRPGEVSDEQNLNGDLPPQGVLSFVVESANREQDFLSRRLGLLPEQMAEIKRENERVYSQLQQLEAWSKHLGVESEELRATVLQNHIHWLESYIGVGNYQALLDYSGINFE